MMKNVYVDSLVTGGSFEATDKQHYRDELPDGTNWKAMEFDSGAYPVRKSYQHRDPYHDHPHYQVLTERGRVKTARCIAEYYNNPELGSSTRWAGWVEYEDGRIEFYNSADYYIGAAHLPKQAYSRFQEMNLFDS